MITEIQRIEQDKRKFNIICDKVGYDLAIDGEYNTIEKDFKKVQYCRALFIQSQRPIKQTLEDRQIRELRTGHKIILGVC